MRRDDGRFLFLLSARAYNEYVKEAQNFFHLKINKFSMCYGPYNIDILFLWLVIIIP